MIICLIFALLSTLVYINTIVSDIVNSRLNPYGSDDAAKRAEYSSKMKYWLMAIMAITWGIYIRLG